MGWVAKPTTFHLCCPSGQTRTSPGGIINWGAGFLPAQHQATTVNVNDPDQPIADLFPPKSFEMATPARDRVGLSLLEKLNQIHHSPNGF